MTDPSTRDLAVLSFVTLDGVMQSPSMPAEDTSGGFTQGGWAARHWEGVMPHVERIAMATPYDILLGRRTYDIFAGHWPNAPRSDLGDRLNAAQKYVATSQSTPLGWENSQALNGDVARAVEDLKRQDGPLLQVHGSSMLIQTLHAHDLIDEYRIWTFPVVVGAGKRLFEAHALRREYALADAATLKNGVTYQRLRRV